LLNSSSKKKLGMKAVKQTKTGVKVFHIVKDGKTYVTDKEPLSFFEKLKKNYIGRQKKK